MPEHPVTPQDDDVSSFDLAAPDSLRRPPPEDLIQTIKEYGRQAGRRRHQPRRPEDPQPHAPRAALRLQGLRALSPQRKVTVFGSARTPPDEPAY